MDELCSLVDIFDLDTDELSRQLDLVRSLQQSRKIPEALATKYVSMIQQELEERGVGESLLSQIEQIAEPASVSPKTSPKPSFSSSPFPTYGRSSSPPAQPIPSVQTVRTATVTFVAPVKPKSTAAEVVPASAASKHVPSDDDSSDEVVAFSYPRLQQQNVMRGFVVVSENTRSTARQRLKRKPKLVDVDPEKLKQKQKDERRKQSEERMKEREERKRKSEANAPQRKQRETRKVVLSSSTDAKPSSSAGSLLSEPEVSTASDSATETSSTTEAVGNLSPEAATYSEDPMPSDSSSKVQTGTHGTSGDEESSSVDDDMRPGEVQHHDADLSDDSEAVSEDEQENVVLIEEEEERHAESVKQSEEVFANGIAAEQPNPSLEELRERDDASSSVSAAVLTSDILDDKAVSQPVAPPVANLSVVATPLDVPVNEDFLEQVRDLDAPSTTAPVQIVDSTKNVTVPAASATTPSNSAPAVRSTSPTATAKAAARKGEAVRKEREPSRPSITSSNTKYPCSPTDLLAARYPPFASYFADENDKDSSRAAVAMLTEWVKDIHSERHPEADVDETGQTRDPSVAVYVTHTRRGELNETIQLAGDSLGWRLSYEFGRGLWHINWAWQKCPKSMRDRLFFFQRVHRFPNTGSFLTRKDKIAKNLLRLARLPGKTGEFFRDVVPRTFTLPGDYSAFCNAFFEESEACDAAGEKNWWILKPATLSRGRGIRVINSIDQVEYSEPSVLQQYLRKPLLMDGRKFDMRIYVLVTEFRPTLKAFIYSEGIARFAKLAYSMSEEARTNTFVHLTNTSINKVSDGRAVDDSQIKFKLSSVLERLSGRVDLGVLWNRIVECVLASLIAVEEHIDSHPCCYELFGYDVMIDANFKPWLLEVNASPMLQLDGEIDEVVKIPMVRDCMRIVTHGIPSVDADALVQFLEDEGVDAPFTDVWRKRILGDNWQQSVLAKPDPSTMMLGGFQQIAPSALYSKISKLKRSCG